MTKAVIVLFFSFLISSMAYASGYLTIKEPLYKDALGSAFNYYPYINNYSPDVSLFIQEPLSAKWSFISYNGYVQGTTLVLDEAVAYSFTDRFRMGIGANYSDGLIIDTASGNQRYRNLEGKVWGEYKLW